MAFPSCPPGCNRNPSPTRRCTSSFTRADSPRPRASTTGRPCASARKNRSSSTTCAPTWRRNPTSPRRIPTSSRASMPSSNPRASTRPAGRSPKTCHRAREPKAPMSTERPIGSAVGRISDPSSKTADAKMEPGAPPDLRMSRRDLLQGMAAAGVLATLPRRLLAAADAPHPVTRYLATLARPDGGYAFADQADSHLTPTFGAIGCFHLLGLPPPNRDALVEFVRTHHPSRLKKLEQERRGFEYQQVQALAWLEADASEFREKISAWSEPLAYMKRYEQHGYPVFQSELGAVACRALLGLPLAPVQE